MTGRWMNAATAVLIFLLAVLSVLIGLNFTELGREIQGLSSQNLEVAPLYRFMVILDGSDSDAVISLKQGLDGATEDFGVMYELWSFDGEDKGAQIRRQMDIGIESDVDGIFVQAMADEDFESLFNKAKLRQIPVITLGNEIPSAEKLSFITYNRYQMGSRIGKLLNENLAADYVADGKVILLQNSNLVDWDQALAIQESMYEGFQVTPINVESSGESILNAEGLANDILREYGDIRAIICLSSTETLGVIQAIKERNMINEIVVIGSGDSEEILDYVQRGVLYATIVPDNARIGYEAILDLTKYKAGAFVSQYRDINVNIITAAELQNYMDIRTGEAVDDE